MLPFKVTYSVFVTFVVVKSSISKFLILYAFREIKLVFVVDFSRARKLKKVFECVTTHLSNQFAPKMDGV